MPSRDVLIDSEAVTRRMLQVRGLHNYAPDDLVAAVEFLTETHSRFPFADLIGQQLDLDSAAEAFELALSSEAPRVAVRLGGDSNSAPRR